MVNEKSRATGENASQSRCQGPAARADTWAAERSPIPVLPSCLFRQLILPSAQSLKPQVWSREVGETENVEERLVVLVQSPCRLRGIGGKASRYLRWLSNGPMSCLKKTKLDSGAVSVP